ncbi:hypothetical protein TERTU_2224 [Teredinibacter turnerae T7901]|uniref:Uncharacterized protein n=1 Tax=Teredinibacter turnerae (strain ATCC 39867 / T7901) TaxID=377629 RepID=C5BJK0_TERTT|nr:hypothetical protein [Teredinibacter turnerae]ACR10873.1 hypothetical protein TERTU_2224 [Teredinibacter turnerae T7901]
MAIEIRQLTINTVSPESADKTLTSGQSTMNMVEEIDDAAVALLEQRMASIKESMAVEVRRLIAEFMEEQRNR